MALLAPSTASSRTPAPNRAAAARANYWDRRSGDRCPPDFRAQVESLRPVDPSLEFLPGAAKKRRTRDIKAFDANEITTNPSQSWGSAFMHKNLFEARVAQRFSDTKLAWTVQVRSLKAELGKSGNFGGSVGVEMAMGAFVVLLPPAVLALLSEIVANENGRGRTWKWAHGEVDRQLAVFDDVREQAIGMMWRGAEAQCPDFSSIFNLAITRAKADISAHAANWTAPPPRPFNERYPVGYALLMLALGGLLGALLEPLKHSASNSEKCSTPQK